MLGMAYIFCHIVVQEKEPAASGFTNRRTRPVFRDDTILQIAMMPDLWANGDSDTGG